MSELDKDMDIIAKSLAKASDEEGALPETQGAVEEYDNTDESKPKIHLTDAAMKRQSKLSAEKRKKDKGAEEVEKAAPAGVDEDKFKRCKEEVKRKQGKKVNEYAVCTASLKKSDVRDMLCRIVDQVYNLGPDALKKATEHLSEGQKELLGKILKKAKGEQVMSTEKIEKAEAKNLDKEAIKKPKNVKDLDSHEVPQDPQGFDAEDEKMVKFEMAEHKHQGDNSPEGIEGQVIKAKQEKDDEEYEMPKKDAIKEHQKLVQVLESPSHKDDKKEAKKQKKELKEMKKSNLDEVLENEANLVVICKAMQAKGKSKEDFLNQAKKRNMDSAKCEKCWDMASKKMEKSVKWNDWNADVLGASTKRGRNLVVKGFNEYLESEGQKAEELAKSKTEIFSNPSEYKGGKLSLNDLIEQGLDRSQDQINSTKEKVASAALRTAKFSKSFSDEDLNSTLRISQEDAEKAIDKDSKEGK